MVLTRSSAAQALELGRRDGMVRAAMRARVRRLLTRYGCPPDGQERAVQLVIERAELFARAA